MPRFIYHSVHAVMNLLHKMVDANVTLGGHLDLDKESPMFFCSNHFTRFETFMMPNIFYRKLDMDVRSLGDSSLFIGKFSDILHTLGTISTSNPKRNEIIISDLMRGKHNWIIYPEGGMMKNKKVSKGNQSFVLHVKEGQKNVHTGATVLALKSELEKMRFSQAQKDCNLEDVQAMRKQYDMDANDHLAYRSTKMIPVTITYTPMYPGANWVMDMAGRFFNDVSQTLLEELEIEGNILLEGSMHICLGEPLDVAYYIGEAKKHLSVAGEPINDTAIIEHCKSEMTTIMMDRIYANVEVNFDHLFALVIALWEEDRNLDINEFKTRLFMMALSLKELKTVKINKELKGGFYKILSDETYDRFDNAFELALKQGTLVKVDDKHVVVDKKVFEDEHDFESIRLKNTFLVVFHEIAMLDVLISCMKKVVDMPRAIVQLEASTKLHEMDIGIFNKEYQQFYSLLYSKPKEVGTPFFLFKPEFANGVVLSHGYKSAPQEVRALAEYIHSLGFNVYGVRLSGHGTMPEDLRDRTWEDWYDSYTLGYAAIAQVSQKIYLAGFSTGGLLALLAASRKKRCIDGLISINTALQLNDIQFNYVLPTVKVLNNFLALFNADIDYVEGEPENPDINYSKHYLSSVGELKKLMEKTDEVLGEITTPILIIQGDNDPVVSPQSADIIEDKVASKVKYKVSVKSDFHVIVTRDEKQAVFDAVKAFLVR